MFIETHHPDFRVDSQTEKGMKFQDRVTLNQPQAKISTHLQTSHGGELNCG